MDELGGWVHSCPHVGEVNHAFGMLDLCLLDHAPGFIGASFVFHVSFHISYCNQFLPRRRWSTR